MLKRMLTRMVWAGALLAAFAGTAEAAPALPSEPKAFTLEVALANAVRNNPNIQAAEARLRQAKLEKEQQDLWWARPLNANANYMLGNNQFSAQGTYLPTAAVGVGVNLGELLSGPKQAARAEQAVRIAEADLRRTTLEVAAQVTAAYQEYQAAKQVASFSGDFVNAAETDVRLAERQFSRGLGQVNSLLGARLAVARARADQVQTSGNVATAWSNLLSLMGASDWLPGETAGDVANRR